MLRLPPADAQPRFFSSVVDLKWTAWLKSLSFLCVLCVFAVQFKPAARQAASFSLFAMNEVHEDAAVSARSAVKRSCHSRMILLDTRKPPLPNTGNGGEHTHTMGRRYCAMRLMETTRREPAGLTLRGAGLPRPEQQRPKSSGSHYPQQSGSGLRHRLGRRRNGRRCRRNLRRLRLRLRRLRRLRGQRRRCRRRGRRLVRSSWRRRRLRLDRGRSRRWVRRKRRRGREAQRDHRRALGREPRRDQPHHHQQPHQSKFLPMHRKHLLPP